MRSRAWAPLRRPPPWQRWAAQPLPTRPWPSPHLHPPPGRRLCPPLRPQHRPPLALRPSHVAWPKPPRTPRARRLAPARLRQSEVRMRMWRCWKRCSPTPARPARTATNGACAPSSHRTLLAPRHADSAWRRPLVTGDGATPLRAGCGFGRYDVRLLCEHLVAQDTP